MNEEIARLKREAAEVNDAYTFNAINQYENGGCDPLILIHCIKSLGRQVRNLRNN